MSHLKGQMPMLVNELLIINFQLVDQAAFLMPVWQLIVLPLHLKQNKKNPQVSWQVYSKV